RTVLSRCPGKHLGAVYRARLRVAIQVRESRRGATPLGNRRYDAARAHRKRSLAGVPGHRWDGIRASTAAVRPDESPDDDRSVFRAARRVGRDELLSVARWGHRDAMDG